MGLINVSVIYLDGTKENFIGCKNFVVEDRVAVISYGPKKSYFIPIYNVKRFLAEECDEKN